MRFSAITSLLMGASAVVASPTQVERAACPVGAANPSKTVAALKSAGVIPTLIPSLTPKVDGKFAFGSKQVNLGNTFTTLETVITPSYYITSEKDCPADTTYSIFIVDPDVPGPSGAPVVHVRVNFLHWLISGVKPCTSTGANTVTLFEPPTPASPQEQHTYTFLIYREPAGYKPDIISAQARPAFDIIGYATRGKLTLVGANYFNESITDGILPPTPGGTLGGLPLPS